MKSIIFFLLIFCHTVNAQVLNYGGIGNASQFQGRNVSPAAPSNGQTLVWNATYMAWTPGSAGGSGGIGTVTYVGSGTGLLGGPITTTGTLSVDVGLSANQIIQFTSDDRYPAGDGSLITNVNAVRIQQVSISTTSPTSAQVLTYNSSISKWEPAITATMGVSNIVSGVGLVAGTITSSGTINVDVGTAANKIVQFTVNDQYPAVDGFLITNLNAINSLVASTGLTGGTITRSGTIAVDVGITANKIIQLNVNAKLPAVDGFFLTNINAVKLQGNDVISGIPIAGQVLSWNATTSQWQGLAPATSGTVTNVASGTGLLGGPITSVGTLRVDVGVTANQIVQLNVNSKLPAVDGFQLTNLNAIRIQGTAISSTAPTASQVLTFNSTLSQWAAATPSSSVALSSITAATTANTIANAGFAQVWNWSSLGGATALVLADTASGSGSKVLVVNSATDIDSSIGVSINMTGSGGAIDATGLAVSQNSGNSSAATFLHASGNPGRPTVLITTPSQSGFGLDIKGSAGGAVPLLRLANTGTSATNNSTQITFAANDAGATLKTISAIKGIMPINTSGGSLGALSFSTASNGTLIEQMRIDQLGNVSIGTTSAFFVGANGNVGIGVTAPSVQLQVQGAGTTNTNWTIGGSGGGALYLSDTGSSVNNGGQILFGAGQGIFAGIKAAIQTGGPTGDLIFQTRSGSTVDERMRILSAGNVGIGTMTPGGRLHVWTGNPGTVTANGDADDLIVSGAANTGMSILTPDANNSNLMFGSPTVAAGSLLTWNYNTGLFSINNNKSGGQIVFLANGGQEKMRIDAGGNVGIGTTTPTTQLQTTGTLRFSNFGAGAATFDANGNISSVSDESLKDIQRDFTDSLEQIKLIIPIVYKWKDISGLDTENEYVGWSAQNLRSAVEGATYAKKIWIDADGRKIRNQDEREVDISESAAIQESKASIAKKLPDDAHKTELLSVSDRAVIAAIVNSLKEIDERIKALEKAK